MRRFCESCMTCRHQASLAVTCNLTNSRTTRSTAVVRYAYDTLSMRPLRGNKYIGRIFSIDDVRREPLCRPVTATVQVPQHTCRERRRPSRTSMPRIKVLILHHENASFGTNSHTGARLVAKQSVQRNIVSLKHNSGPQRFLSVVTPPCQVCMPPAASRSIA